ncbi:MAG: PAS domain S-box protein [Myxococcota bacterium]|nr:PAS domain S-box protein [Myxococcota bacterium]
MSKVFVDAADPILIEDLEGCVVDMNLEAERAYGWSRAELLGRPIRTIVPEERHGQANDLLARCRRGESVRNIEGLRRDKAGHVIPVLLTLSLLRDEDSKPIAIASMAKDISAQKEAESRLETLSKVFMDAADPILIEDLDGRIVDMNHAAERIYGWARDRLIGKPILVIVPIENHDDARDLLERCKAGELIRNVEAFRQTKQGEVRPILLTLSLLRDTDGRPTGLVSIAKDITAQKAAEKKLRSMSKVFMESADPIIIEDLGGDVIELNREAEEAYGWSRDELLGKPIRTLVPEERHDQALELLALCRAGEDVRNVEGVRITKSGQEIPVLLTLSLLRDDENHPVGIASLAKDIGEQKATEAKLRSMSKVFMEAADPILIENLDGVVIDMNQEAERSYGWSRDELLGKPITTIVPEPRHGQAQELLARCKSGQEVRNVEGIRRTRSRLEIPVLLTLSLLRNEEGEPVAIASLAKDISDQKAAEGKLRDYQDHLEELVARRTKELEGANAQLEEAKHAADEANRAKSDFLANMSHELRTPMNAIIGYSEMLLEEAEDQSLDEFSTDLAKIRGAGRHLLGLINDILDLSKIEAGKMDLYLESFELRGLLDDVASTVASLVDKKRNRLVLEAPDDPGTVKCDLTKLRQMLFNLISNAAKFTEDGTITLSVSRTACEGGDRVTYAVSDSGIGIPADKLGTLFEEFSQVEATTARDFGGTGLGLSITRRFAEMMGGSIEVHSTLGEGSTFTIELPAEVVEQDAETQVSDADLPAEGTSILVIDDDATARDLIRRSLEREGHRVVCADGGEEGLRLARQVRPLLVTLDALMPGKDGWAVLRELKADPELCDIPVVMISMLGGSEMGLALGATDYLAKPVDRDALRAVLRRQGLDLRGAGVLVIEDDPQTRLLLRRMLEKEGCRVTEAAHGGEGLERMQENRPDMVLLDLMMPVMDGFAFVGELRRVPEWRDVPVIVSTAKDLTVDERAALSGVVEAVIEKHASSLDDLLLHVRGALASGDEAAAS